MDQNSDYQVTLDSTLTLSTSGVSKCTSGGVFTIATTNSVLFDFDDVPQSGQVRFTNTDGGQADVSFSNGAMTVTIGGQDTNFSAQQVESFCN